MRFWQKPVSSLRSLFESKSNSGPTTLSTLFPSRPASRHEHAQDDDQRIERASLDMPRIPSPWSTTRTVDVSPGSSTAGPPDLRHLQHSSRILQPPVTTTSLSAPRYLPLVTVNSPTSPAKGSKLASKQPSFQAGIAQPLKDLSMATQSPQMAPVPLRRDRPHTMESSPRISKTKIENSNGDSQSARESSGDGPVEGTVRSPPPHVNRADKPKIPSKSISGPGKVNLEPLIPAHDEKVSPFSTPPSSDESLETVSDGLDRRRVSQNETRGTPGRHIAPQPTLQSSRETQHPSNPKVRGPDARRLGFSRDDVSHYLLAEPPPGLPPRRVQGQQRFHASNVEQAELSTPFLANPVMRNESPQLQRTITSPPEFLPPPKRALASTTPHITQAERLHPSHKVDHDKARSSYTAIDESERQESEMISATSGYPEVGSSNRRHPYIKSSIREIDTKYDSRLIDICGQHVCTTGHLTRIWDSTTGELVFSLGYGDREIRVTALAFKPGVNAREEGFRLWLGTSHGDIQEIDIATQEIVCTKSGVHDKREVIKIYRHQGSMWTLDDGGKLCIWPGDETGLPDLQRNPFSQTVPKGHTFSIIIQDTLWMATGKDIRIFRPNASASLAFSLTSVPLTQPGIGIVTSGAVVSGQLDRVYFGHADGKITIYSTVNYTCLGIVSVSVYKISSLAGAGSYLWAGYNTGMLYVYDTRTQPWTTRKDWTAHGGPVLNVSTDRSSLWKEGVLRVVSLGADNTLRFWDGTLEDDWLGKHKASLMTRSDMLIFLESTRCKTMILNIVPFGR